VIAYYARGRAHYDLGEFEAANADLNLSYRYITEVASFATLFPVASAVKADGLYAANALYYFGATQAALGDDEAALAAFTQAIERSRTVALPRVARGQLLLKTQKYAEARDDFTAAIAQYTRDKDDSPRVGEAYLGNGLAWLALNRPDSAVSNFQVALRTLPTSFEANFGLGQSLARTNKPDEALTPLSAALVLAQTDEQRAQVLWWRARAHSLAGRRPEEVADLQTLAALTGGGTLVPTAQARLTEIAIQSRGTNTPTPRVTATATRTATVARTTTRTATVTPPPSPSPTLNRTAYPASGTPASPTPTRPGTGYPPRTPRP
jgi:tetratricopeptide (TPR) repeat protein